MTLIILQLKSTQIHEIGRSSDYSMTVIAWTNRKSYHCQKLGVVLGSLNRPLGHLFSDQRLLVVLVQQLEKHWILDSRTWTVVDQ